MQSKVFEGKSGEGRIHFLRLDKGEELVATLKDYCQQEKVALGQINGLGAVGSFVVGLFEPEKKEYLSGEHEGAFEIVGLTGNVTKMKGQTYLHLHASFADQENKVWGGHLNEAWISATGEIWISEICGAGVEDVDREFSEEIGLNLLKFENWERIKIDD